MICGTLWSPEPFHTCAVALWLLPWLMCVIWTNHCPLPPRLRYPSKTRFKGESRGEMWMFIESSACSSVPATALQVKNCLFHRWENWAWQHAQSSRTNRDGVWAQVQVSSNPKPLLHCHTSPNPILQSSPFLIWRDENLLFTIFLKILCLPSLRLLMT